MNLEAFKHRKADDYPKDSQPEQMNTGDSLKVPSLDERQKNEAQENIIIEEIRNIIKQAYALETSIMPEQIMEIREQLAKIPAVVVNFDDTITQPPMMEQNNKMIPISLRDNCSIRSLIQEVLKLAAVDIKYETNKKHAEEFKKILGQDAHAKEKRDEVTKRYRNILKYFYSHVFAGH